MIGPKPVGPTTGTGTGTGTDTGGGTSTTTLYCGDPNGDVDGDGIANKNDPDIDGDLLPNQLEQVIGTDQCKADTDGDGVEDGYEYQSAIDLNNDDYQNVNQVVFYPHKLPYPNPLFKDANTDYDGDGLTLGVEYDLWRYSYTVSHTATRTLTPLSYSDGTRYSLSTLQNGTGVRVPSMTAANYTPPQAFNSWATLNGYENPLLHDVGGSTWAAFNLYDFNRDGSVTADEQYYWANGDPQRVRVRRQRDEDGDGLTNYDEPTGRSAGRAGGAPATATRAPTPSQYAGTSPTTPTATATASSTAPTTRTTTTCRTSWSSAASARAIGRSRAAGRPAWPPAASRRAPRSPRAA